ncbi:hypothetical protein [Halobacteriovorax sp. HLS]|uniref:hypothetical protein n=1 Tax=Halobacteriovorax sp. HLS TaxID=2234000 RepID=UPI000FD930D8|nr:hypothetical protein [Halobacteriovorax sp. HLS]
MKTLILLVTLMTIAPISLSQERKFGTTTRYRKSTNSLIQWDKLDPVDYLDYDLWLNDTKLKDRWPNWEKTVREKRQKESLGKVLDCVGECRMFRGVGNYRTQFRSAVMEGDELITSSDSYAWVFLLDGTMVRLSPSSSITFREINIGVDETFIHVRINSGNILWLSRMNEKFKEVNERETDSIFLPMSYYEAMPITDKVKVVEGDLFSLLEKKKTVLKQYQRLNKLIEENNKKFKKRDTYAFLVSPNGTVAGRNLNIEFISLIGNLSYVKSRTYSQLGLDLGVEDSDKSSEASFYLRGFENKESITLTPGQWYRIGKKGREINLYQDTQLQQIGELLTKRIPSILVGRELLFEKYSTFMNEAQDADVLAYDHSYRQWGKMSDPKSDMSLRLSYLLEYTRRIETTNLLSSGRLRDKLIARGEPTDDMEYSLKFFNKALVNYMRANDDPTLEESDREVLNSVTKKYWKIINDIK